MRRPGWIAVPIIAACVAAATMHAWNAFAQETARATPEASFTPPGDCIPDPVLAATVQALQACSKRFSATHEFILTLHEFRVRSTDPKARADPAIAKAVAEEAVEKLRKANEGKAGQILLSFRSLVMPRDALLFPAGADHCINVWSVVIDRAVPGFGDDEFRTVAIALVCARVDKAGNAIRVVELTGSERFRVKSDSFKERMRSLAPFEEFDRALKTLKMVALQ